MLWILFAEATRRPERSKKQKKTCRYLRKPILINFFPPSWLTSQACLVRHSCGDGAVKPYQEVRRAWASEPDGKHYRIDGKEWFADSCFRALGETSVTEQRQITVPDLIGRALSRSNTSHEILGEGQTRFEAEIAAALEPFVQDGVLVEHIVARASIFGRLPCGDQHCS